MPWVLGIDWVAVCGGLCRRSRCVWFAYKVWPWCLVRTMYFVVCFEIFFCLCK